MADARMKYPPKNHKKRKGEKDVKRKILSSFLALVMALSLLPMSAFATEGTGTWAGTADTKWYDPANPKLEYTLTTEEQLAGLAELVSGDVTFKGVTIKLGGNMDLYCEDTSDAADGDPVTFRPIGDKSKDGTFEGIFDGQGYTISNLYQNGWDLGYQWGAYGSYGLFGNINDATIKNLTISGAESYIEGGDVGGITGSATGTCVFENITISDSAFATYNNGCGGIIAWSGAGNYTFKNITIEEDVVLAGLWGSFDSSIGGIVGQAEPGATYNFENVDIACRIDAYNDCTASYDYYNYRMCGMVMGRLEETTTIDGTNYPDTSKYNITCKNVTVTYGDWYDYHYCEPTPADMNGGRGMRVEPGYAYGGLPADYDHSNCTANHMNVIPFDQVFGGDQLGVKGLKTYDGVTVKYPDPKDHTALREMVNTADAGATITLPENICEVCFATVDKDIIVTAAEGEVIPVDTDAIFKVVGEGSVSIIGGTYAYKPDNFVAEGYKAVENEDGTWTVVKRPYIAQVGETKYYDLQTALNACTNGETVKLIADVTYGEDDVVYAHGGATGFGNYDQYNPSIVYIGGTKGATEAENQPSNVNAVLDLNGHTITNNANAYLFLIMDNAKVTFKNSQETGGIDGKTNYPVIWSTGTDTVVTIENGKYTTANAEGLMWATHSGDLVINGGEFSTTAEDASLLIIRNAYDRDKAEYFVEGNAEVIVKGGTFHGFNPEKMMDDSTKPFTEFNAVAEGYKAFEVQSNTWVVMPADATVTVTFNSNGGSSVESQTVGFNTSVTQPDNPFRNGYRFLGWYLDGATSPYDFSTPVTDDMTLIAQWRKTSPKPVAPPADDDEDIPDNPPATGSCDGGENCPSAPYVDVDQSLWYHDGIDYVIVKELMNGVADNLFAPNGTTNRAMIVTILHRLEGTPEAAPSSFLDVPADQWYTDAVGWAAANGIVTGYDADTFGPLDPITREQMAAILYRYANYKGYDVSAGEDTNILSYVDAESVSEYAVTPMQWAVGEGLIAGMEDNTLAPTGTALRSQVATILMRFCENMVK